MNRLLNQLVGELLPAIPVAELPVTPAFREP